MDIYIKRILILVINLTTNFSYTLMYRGVIFHKWLINDTRWYTYTQKNLCISNTLYKTREFLESQMIVSTTRTLFIKTRYYKIKRMKTLYHLNVVRPMFTRHHSDSGGHYRIFEGIYKIIRRRNWYRSP